MNMDDKTRLLGLVNKGRMTKIAVDKILGDALDKRKTETVNQIVHCFAQGQHGTELLGNVAELAAYMKMEKELAMDVNRGDQAFVELEELENDNRDDDRDDSNYRSEEPYSSY